MPTKVTSLDTFKTELKKDYQDGKTPLEDAIKRLVWLGFTDQQAYDYLKK